MTRLLRILLLPALLFAASAAFAGNAWTTNSLGQNLVNLPSVADWENFLVQVLVGQFGAPLATGSPPVATGACGTGLTNFAGGQFAGQFKAGAGCAATAITLTFAYAAPNGYTCRIQDVTTPANATNQNASTATTAVFSSTLTLNDIAQYVCFAY